MEYVSLHTHTTYSYADGYGTVEEHVDRVAELGMGALALSEHGNVDSHAALERECKRVNIKPIFGLEAYFGPVGEKQTQAKTHLTIFAMNEEGYHNLNKIVTQSYIDSYYFPTVSPTTLRKYNEGIAVLSGCSDSLISCSLLGGKFTGPKKEPINFRTDDGLWDIPTSAADRKIQWFLDVFGPERFFLEVQRFPKLDRTCALNSTFAKLGERHGVSLIATSDVHYPRPTDNAMQAVLHGARWQSTPEIAAETAWEFQANLTYPESDDEIVANLVSTGLSLPQAKTAVSNTAELASRCNVELPKAQPLRFSTTGGRTAEQELKRNLVKGWNHRVSQRPNLLERKTEYFDRMKEELSVIIPKDFCDYFLATADLCQYAKSQDVTVGPGRGSAAGSLVCYVLGITEIDPLHPTFKRMIFERFIDPNREDNPDIDLDFDDELRYKVAERARYTYGPENVANVANHIGYKGKNTLKDIARAFRLPQKTFEPIAKRIPERTETDERVDDSILDVLEAYGSDPVIANLKEKFERELSFAVALEGNRHSRGIHAGGFVISSEPITNVCAIYTKEKGSGRKKQYAQVIPYEKRDAEHLGMLKMDFLGLSTMGVIGKIRNWIGMDLDTLYSLFYNADKRVHDYVLKSFQDDDLTGIFQYEGGTTRQVTSEVKPSNFDELAACNALSRPGPMYGKDASGYTQTQNYIAVKNGERDWKRIHPSGFDRHVEWTYGQIVYQEQIMWILRDLAGFSTGRVLKVRKIIGKKLGEHQFAELWDEFKTGCGANGVSEDDAASVWSAIRTAAGYAFNTAHAYSYALIAWWQAYFKINHKVEFFAASLAKNGDGKDDLPRRTMLLQDVAANNILIDSFNPNLMDAQWVPVYDNMGILKQMIRPGWRQLPGIGEATAEDIICARSDYRNADRQFNWWDLINVSGIGEPTIMKMVEWVGQSDPLGIFRTERQLSVFRKQCENGEFDGTGLPDFDDYIMSNEISDAGTGWVGFVCLVQNIVYKDEIETIRSKTGKSVDEIRAEMDAPEKSKKATLFGYDEYGEVALRVSRWVFDGLAERITAITKDHHIVVVWGRTFAGRDRSIQVRNIWVLDPD